MVIAGAFPSPVGYADVITFTTHKTICGPRGAVIMSTDEDIANTIDLAVFPGAQGGPHTNKFAAMAVAFQIAQSDAYKRTMMRIVENAQALAAALEGEGAVKVEVVGLVSVDQVGDDHRFQILFGKKHMGVMIGLKPLT